MIAEEIKVKNRFSGALWANEVKSKTSLIVGLGATGSYLSLFLGRLGLKELTLVDPDKFEIHNIGSQLATFNDVGKHKVNAIKQHLLAATDVKYIQSYNRKIEEMGSNLFYKDIICSTLDSMEGRKYVFNNFLTYSPNQSLFFDSRIGAELWEVYCIPKSNKEKIEKYKETLFSDDQGNVGACNYQQSSHSACGAALKIVELYTNFITNKVTEEPDDLPFKVTNDIRNCVYGIYN